MNSQYKFSTDLSYDAIADIISKKKATRFFGGGIYGKLHDDRIEINYASQPNSKKISFIGKIFETSTNTMITGDFKSFIQSSEIFSVMKVFGVIFIILIFYSRPDIIALIISLHFLLIFFLAIIILERVLTSATEGDKAEILKFIEKELRAKQCPPDKDI